MLQDAGTYVADSVFTFDAMAKRIAIWTAAGDLGRAFLLPPELGFRLQSAFAIPSGEFAIVSNVGPAIVPPGQAAVLDSVAVTMVDATGEMIAEITRIPSAEIRAVPSSSGDGNVMFSPLILGPEAEYNVRSSCFEYGWSADWTIVRLCSRTSEVDTLRFQLPVRPLTSAMFDAWLADWIERRHSNAGRMERSGYEEYFRATWLPILHESLPAFDRMLSDDEGYLWLRRFRFLNEPETDWIIVSDQGVVVARIKLDGAFEPMHITIDHMAGVRRDEWEREQVIIVPFERTG